MAATHEFTYYKPQNLAEVLSLLEQYNSDARILAGGTDLVVYIKEDMDKPKIVIDVKNVLELKKIEVTDTGLFLGALTTFSDIMKNEHIKEEYLVLWESAKMVASVGIRNRATVAGNICSAVPSLDSAPALLVYEADVIVESTKGSRRIPILEWFKAPRKTAKNPDEVLLGIEIKKPADKNAGCYLKLGRYGGEDLAQAGVAVFLNTKMEIRVACCAVGPIPKRIFSVENLLSGKDLTPELMAQAQELLVSEISPITDIRSSKEYRFHMCKIMLERGLQVCKDRLNGIKIDNKTVLGG